MSLTDLLLPTYIQMLEALSCWLEKAKAELPEDKSEALLKARLAPDMFPLSSQVRFSCLQAQEAIFRLGRRAIPDFLEELAREGQGAGENPGSISEAQERIRQALIRLRGVTPETLMLRRDELVTIKLPNGMIFDMTDDQYARDWALPQFYFHINTAYAILRNQGVSLGKADYVQHAFAYLRSEMTSDA
ncbi:DUF1993 family protein [Microbulbifer sp. JMSA004]|uniref:DUF1993 domain-containing protein n=1 Tax=unclassified Microbulbifer TaxID=2619833 RepID=UPI00403B02BB